jgi:hypothetical protein
VLRQQRLEPDLRGPGLALLLLLGLELVLPPFEHRPSRTRTLLRRLLFLGCDQDLNSLALFLPKKVLLG